MLKLDDVEVRAWWKGIGWECVGGMVTSGRLVIVLLVTTRQLIVSNPLPPKHGGVNYSQTTLPKNMRAMSAGMQMPVLTFTKAAVTSTPPMM